MRCCSCSELDLSLFVERVQGTFVRGANNDFVMCQFAPRTECVIVHGANWICHYLWSECRTLLFAERTTTLGRNSSLREQDVLLFM